MNAKSLNKTAMDDHSPRIGTAQIQLLERLCNVCAVSGNEGEVRSIVLEQIRPHVDEVKIDALGNVLAVRRGAGENRLRVMLAAHMDEVGFMITGDEENGIFRFETVGGLDPRQLAGKAVLVGDDHLPGVIGAKPIHLTEGEELSQIITLETLRIDVGPENGKKVKLGDWVSFATRFARLGPSLRAKALDDRLGVATLIELVRQAPSNIDLLAAFTVQEEVGLRGARVAAYALDPQVAFALDSTPANDLPGWEQGSCFSEYDCPENIHYNTRLGLGPAIYIADSATLSDPRLIRHLVDTAEALGIPYQFRQPGGGGTDAGVIHKQRAGIPSVSVSVPGRYAHTAAGLCRLEDWKNTLALLHAALSRISPQILAVER
ncbi:MAG: M42 family metallopeptidase [Anaerolineales bacterium]|nr:M42 family metallopeptidase [Anaerolineales bacterium]